MIEYEKRAWTSHLFDIEGSMVREIMGRVSICVIWSLIVVLFHKYAHRVDIASTPHTLVGLAMGLLLVFRTNASYDRYWEGRKLWGGIINESRNLARASGVFLRGDPGLVATLTAWAAAFPYATMNVLRGEAGPGLGPAADRLPEDEVRSTLAADMVPLAVASRVTACLARGRDLGLISDYVMVSLDGYVGRQIDNLGGCERIRKTPLPFVYVVHLRRALIVYSLTLPFALIDAFGWWTVLVTLLVSYMFFGIDEIGVEIENPFGHDVNDLPLEAFCATVARNLFALSDETLGQDDSEVQSRSPEAAVT